MSLRIILAAALCCAAHQADANPLDAIRNRASTLDRLPNDNVEGVVWQYKGELEKGELDGQKEARIGGLFRMEDEGLYAVGEVIKLPGIHDIEKMIRKILEGEPQLLRLPTGTPTRIGDFKRSRTGRLTLNFDDESEDPNALYGTMILRPKKGQTSVFIGDFQEKEGRRTVRTWQMTVRKTED